MLLGIGLSGVLLASLGASPAVADRQQELLVAESFDRSDGGAWGATDSGQRWRFPKGSAGIALAANGGVMTLPAPGSFGSAMLAGKGSHVRDVDLAFSFTLDRMPGRGGVIVEAIARRSAAGSYRAQVRVAPQGGVWLSFGKMRHGRETSTVGRKALLRGWRYAAGQLVNVRFEALEADATQLRLKVWPAGAAEPRRWHLVSDDIRDDVGAAGRVGIAASLTKRASNVPVQVRFDDLRVSRTLKAAKAPVTRAKPRGQEGGPRTEAQKQEVPVAEATPAPPPAPPPAPTPAPPPAPTPAPPPAPTPANRVRVPNSIDASGSTNVSGALQSFVDSVPNHSTIVFPAGATYRLGGWGIRVNGKDGLTFEGNGTTLRTVGGCEQWNSAFAVGVASPSSNITIQGFKLRGHNPSPGEHFVDCQHEHGVTVHGSTNVLVYDVDVRDVYGDCFYVGEDRWADGVTFRDSACTSAGRNGLAIVRGRNIRIERVAFDNIAIHALDIEPNSPDEGAINVVFTNNTVGTFNQCDCFGGAFFAANGDLDAPVRNIEVSKNLVTGGSLRTLVGDEFFGWSGGRQHRDIRFVDNRSSVSAAGPVLVFKHVDGLVIRGNVQPLSSGELAKLVDTVNVTYEP